MATKKYLVFEDETQALTSKTINAENNTITNITTSELKEYDETYAGKTFVIDANGKWQLVTMSAGVSADDVTILDTDHVFSVKDYGITIAKFNTNTVAKSIGATPDDTKVTTEKCVNDFVTTQVTATGHTLEFTMDSTSFVLTAILKDGDGNALSTQTVDLPLEEMVVNVTYNNTSEEFIFTLKNGNTLKVPASGILNGVVTQTAEQELTNKTIDADDNTIENITNTNLKAVTSEDDIGKIFVVDSTKAWAIEYPQQYKSVTALPSPGNSHFIYILTVDTTSNNKGMYIYDADTSSYIAVDVTDNTTITHTSDKNQLCVAEGSASTGITLSNFKTGQVLTAVPSTHTDASVLTEKAISDAYVPYYGTGQTFAIGHDTNGYFIYEK